MVRDWQAKKLYDAEDEAFKKLTRERLIMEPTLEEARSMVESICKIERVETPSVDELPKQCKFTADYSAIPCQIRVKPERLRDVVIVHELAHHMTHWAFPAHGAEFAATYLRMLGRHCDERVEQIMRASFDQHGVHYSPEHRKSRVRRVAVNFANGSQPLVTLVMDKPPRVMSGIITEADADKLVINDVTLPMDRVRYIEKLIK